MLSCLHFLLEMLKGHWGNCKCASCNENCTDNVILCDGKGVQWLHYNCGGLTEEQFEITNMLKKTAFIQLLLHQLSGFLSTARLQ